MTRRELVRIPTADGIELSATLFFPSEGDGPWPAVMEALPYRKDDLTASYRPSYAELAESGYVVCWLDVRYGLVGRDRDRRVLGGRTA
jgi:uncharacterized protein